MYVEYHVGGAETNGGVGMSGAIVKHLVDREISFRGGFGFFMGDGSECHE